MTAATQGAEAPKSAVVAAMLAKTAPAPTEHELEIAHLRAALAEAEQKLNAAPSTQPSATAISAYQMVSACSLQMV